MDLDKTNPVFARPNTFCSNGAIVPFIISGLSLVLALDAAPGLKYYENPIAWVCIIICACSSVLLLIPRICNWNWNAKYFGFSGMYVGSVSLFGAVPWGCILLYSRLPIFLRLTTFFIYLLILIFWSRRFVNVYKNILKSNKENWSIYKEHEDCFYYHQKVDVKVLEKYLKFRQFPAAKYTILCLFFAFATIPFSADLKLIVGLPFTHIFLAICSVPTDMMAIGLMTRGIIVFYYEPWKIFRRTGKTVYVDISSQ